jgi:hypothetical protein
MTIAVKRPQGRGILRRLGTLLAASGLMIVGAPAPAQAATNPYTPQGVCGSGYYVQRSHALTGATVYQLYNGRYNCVVTMKTASIGRPTKITAGLQVKKSSWAYETGKFAYYAGPIKQYGAGKCVRFFGYHRGTSHTSRWGNCG